MGARRWFGIAVLTVLVSAGCRETSWPIVRIALLAPFEGRYQEIGYNALYAVRLALRANANSRIEFLPVDDGGSVAAALARGQALADDPLVKVIIAVGRNATDPRTQYALGDLPMLLVGQWPTQPIRDGSFALVRADFMNTTSIAETWGVTQAAASPGSISGGDVLALEQFRLLRGNLNDVTVISSGRPADANFKQAYSQMGLFVPEPNLLATLTYDAASMAILAAQEQDVLAALKGITYTGLVGEYRFENGYWVQATDHHYRYDSNGVLVANDSAVE